MALAAVVAAAVLFVAVTAFTGFPAPGPLRRYPASDLQDLVAAIHAEAGPERTPDDCWKRVSDQNAPDGPERPIAAVDYVRSRVVVRERSDLTGEVDRRTDAAVRRALEEIVDADPAFSWRMVLIEASPDGWSPLMDCRLVIQRY